MSEANGPFCELPVERIVLSADEALVIRDGFTVSPGDTLVVLRRHVESFSELTAVVRAWMFELLARVRADLDGSLRPDGFNIAINDGAAARQAVAQLHLHLIPRYLGDVLDPRGGVRCVLSGKAKYWAEG